MSEPLQIYRLGEERLGKDGGGGWRSVANISRGVQYGPRIMGINPGESVEMPRPFVQSPSNVQLMISNGNGASVCLFSFLSLSRVLWNFATDSLCVPGSRDMDYCQ